MFDCFEYELDKNPIIIIATIHARFWRFQKRGRYREFPYRTWEMAKKIKL